MRNMSFSLTTAQFRARKKNVTRRLGWWNLRRGDVVMGVEKGQGLKKGEKVVRMGRILIVSSTPEPLYKITPDDVILEGFPELSTAKFIEMFCQANRCGPTTVVNRILFAYLDGQFQLNNNNASR